jgi:hypothetical protein
MLAASNTLVGQNEWLVLSLGLPSAFRRIGGKSRTSNPASGTGAMLQSNKMLGTGESKAKSAPSVGDTFIRRM